MLSLKVEMHNRRSFFQLPELACLEPEKLQALRDCLSFHPKNYFFFPKYKQGVWDGYITMLKGGAVPTGLLLERAEQIRTHLRINLVVKDKRKGPKFIPFPESYEVPGFKIRPFQRDCVLKMMAAQTGGLVLNATGTGKTFIAGLYFRLLKGTAVFVVDELMLLAQAQKELAIVLGEKVGFIGDSRFEPERISVATIQTLHKHRSKAPFKAWHKGLQVLMLDEVHVMLNQRSQETIKTLSPLTVFGLTATLEMAKEYVLVPAVSLCGPRIFEYDYQKGQEEKFLTPGVCIGVDICRHVPSVNWVPVPDEDPLEVPIPYSEDYDRCLVESRLRNGIVTDLAREGIKRGMSVAILVERVDHVETLSKMLKDIPHRTVYGKVAAEARTLAKKTFERGKISLLIASRVFKKGVSINRLDCIIDAAGMASSNDTRQKFGRGVRLCAEKSGLLYFDIGDKRPKKDGRENRFASATNKRRSTLRKMGVPVQRVSSREGAKSLFNQAEALLQKTLKKFQHIV